MRTYPFPGRDAIEGVALKVDGSIVAVGYRGAAQDEQRQRFSDEAQRRSQCGLGAPTRGYLLPAIQGVATSGCAEHTTFCLSLTDEDGNTAPPITYGTGTSHPYDFDAVRDGGFILAGHLATCSYDCWDGWLVRVDDAGRAVWNVSFGEPNGGAPERLFEECYGVRTVPSGGYVTACGSGGTTGGRRPMRMKAERGLTQDHARHRHGQVHDQVTHEPGQHMARDDAHLRHRGNTRGHDVILDAELKQLPRTARASPVQPTIDRITVPGSSAWLHPGRARRRYPRRR